MRARAPIRSLDHPLPTVPHESLRVALVSPYDYPYPGGVTEHISELYRQLRRMGHEVKIIAPSSTADAELEEHIIKVGKTIVPVPYSGSIGRISLSPRLLLRVRRILRRDPFDVIHIHEPTIPALSQIGRAHV